MQEKSWIEICEELDLNTDIFDDEKWDKMIKRHMEYKGSNFSMKIGGHLIIILEMVKSFPLKW